MAPVPTTTYEGAAGGMNAAVSPHEIADNQGAFIQDILLNQPGLLLRRGAQEAPDSLTANEGTDEPIGIIQTQDPAGNVRVAVLAGNGTTGKLKFWDAAMGTAESVALTLASFPLPGSSGKVILDSKPMLNGGTLIGLSESYELGGRQRLYLWRGGIKPDYSTGSISVSQNGTTVTGVGTSWSSSNISPGMFLIVQDIPAGVVKSVNSGTSITLEAPSPYAWATMAYTLTSLRGFRATVRTGLISTTTGSNTVSGSGTKFKSQGWTANYDIFRASDGVYVGRVGTVANDSGLTLVDAAAVSMANEPYWAWDFTAAYGPDTTARATRETPGFLNCIWDRKQWYGNLSHANEGKGDYITRLWHSSENDPEGVDFDPVSGDFASLPSTKNSNSGLRAMIPAYDSLVVLKADEAHALKGATGNYVANKIGDDGALCGMSAVSWGGGVLWAGREGVWFYDGLQAQNITGGTLGDFWKTAIEGFNPQIDRMWGFIYRDHYILNIENATPPRGVIKGANETIPNRLILSMHLAPLLAKEPPAISLMTNVHHRGAVQISGAFGTSVWYIARHTNATESVSGWAVFDAAKLFNNDGVDEFLTEPDAVLGPDFYFESKRYSLGDNMLKKAWRWLAMTYVAESTPLVLDTIIGLNKRSTTAKSQFLPTTLSWFDLGRQVSTWDELANTSATWDDIASQVYQTKRVKFLKRSQQLGFRIYQPVDMPIGSRVAIGSWALAYKLQPGKY